MLVIVSCDYVIAGWNDIVSEKHDLDREQFLVWCAICTPKLWIDMTIMSMMRACAKFKSTLHYCKQLEGHHACRLPSCQQCMPLNCCRKFWSAINKPSHEKATCWLLHRI